MGELVAPGDLLGFSGAPFPSAVVAAAAQSVRTDAGWHIAPEITETIEAEPTGPRIVIPSLKIVEVVAIRDADTGEVLEGWRLRKGPGVIERSMVRGRGCWPEVVEVDIVHGYAVCPADLYAVVAERSQRGQAGIVRQEGIGGRSVAFSLSSDTPNSRTIARYSLAGRP